MKRWTRYQKVGGGEVEVAYDDESLCSMCGEPVVSASVGGTAICPWCDSGKCRYCHVSVWVLKEEIDDGRSKRELLEHMKWHRARDPDFNQRQLEASRRFDAERE